MVRTSIADVVGRLPRALQNRYAGANSKFWIDRYNDFLGRLERVSAGPNSGTVRIPVPWELAQGVVILPQQIVDVTRAFAYTTANGAEKLEISPSPGGFTINQQIPTASEQVVDGIFSTGFMTAYNGRSYSAASIFANAKVGDAVAVHSGYIYRSPYMAAGPALISWQIDAILSVPQIGGGDNVNCIALPMQEGEYDWYYTSFPETTHAWLFRNYLLIEGHRAYRRISSMTDLSSLNPMWDSLTESYLRFVGELQTDQSSTDSALWEKFWQSNGEEWVRFHSAASSSFRQRGLRTSYSPATRR